MAKARRTRRVIRKIDAWTVLRFSLLFYVSVVAMVLVAGVLLWRSAESAGVITSVEDFVNELLTLENFRFTPSTILRAAIPAGLVLALIGTGLNVLMALLYNVISDLVGGIEVIIDLDEPHPRSLRRRSRDRREPPALPPAPGPAPLPGPLVEGEAVEVPAASEDEEPARSAS